MSKSENQDATEWKRRWKAETAWSARELAKLCCGWNPENEVFPDPAAYNRTMERILRAVRVGDLQPMDLTIPATRDEFFYGFAAFFRVQQAANWALKSYPETFPWERRDWSLPPLDDLSAPLADATGSNPAIPPEFSTVPNQAEQSDFVTGEVVVTTVPRGNVGTTGTGVFRRASNGTWEMGFDGERRAGVAHLDGFDLVRQLLERPGIPIPAYMLMVGPDVVSGGGNTPVVALSHGEPSMDSNYRRQVEDEVRELNHQIDAARNAGNRGIAADLEREVADLEAHLRGNTGLGGRTRNIGSDFNKLRKAAWARYVRALDRLQTLELSALRQHLVQSVRSGSSFVYAPSDEVIWDTATTEL